jgi:hypothetical protein
MGLRWCGLTGLSSSSLVPSFSAACGGGGWQFFSFNLQRRLTWQDRSEMEKPAD